MTPDPHKTTTTAAQTVIYFLGTIAILGLGGTIALVAARADPAGIALVSSSTGAALGGLTAILSQTNRPSGPSPSPIGPITGDNPVINNPTDPNDPPASP